MDILPEYFGVFRPGYGFHTYMILVKNTQRIVDEIRWNSLENISIDETILMPSTVPITEYKNTRVCWNTQESNELYILRNGTSYKFLPFEILTISSEKTYPVIFFKTSSYFPSTVTNRKYKYSLTKEESEEVYNKMIEYKVLFNEEDKEEKNSSIPAFVIQNHIENERNKNGICVITLKLLKDCKNLTVLSCFHIFEYDSIKIKNVYSNIIKNTKTKYINCILLQYTDLKNYIVRPKNPLVYSKKSTIHGKGIFSASIIPKNTEIMRYIDHIHGHPFMYDDSYLINHSSKHANVFLKYYNRDGCNYSIVVSNRPIHKNDELLIDYLSMQDMYPWLGGITFTEK